MNKFRSKREKNSAAAGNQGAAEAAATAAVAVEEEMGASKKIPTTTTTTTTTTVAALPKTSSIAGENEQTTRHQSYQYTYDLIHLYNNLNHKYRAEAFDSLDLAHTDTHNVFEFKTKLLFSVIVVNHFLIISLTLHFLLVSVKFDSHLYPTFDNHFNFSEPRLDLILKNVCQVTNYFGLVGKIMCGM